MKPYIMKIKYKVVSVLPEVIGISERGKQILGASEITANLYCNCVYL